MLRITPYTTEQYEPILAKRLQAAKSARREKQEWQWEINETLIYDALGGTMPTSFNFEEDLESFAHFLESRKTDKPIAINYIFKYIRYLLSQMAANPPAVVVRPASESLGDQRKAEVADFACRYVNRQHDMQEVTDLRNLRTLTKGTGFIKVAYDPDRGDIIEFDEETGDLLLEGDLNIYSPSNWDIFPNPDAVAGQPLGWFFERLRFTKEEAMARWPEHQELIEQALNAKRRPSWRRFWNKEDNGEAYAEETIEVYEYWEEGTPYNAYRGRFAYCLDNGKILGGLGVSPSPEGKLPLDVLTDIDVEDEFWGKSVIEYMEAIQMVLNGLDEADLANLEAHHVVRMAINQEETQLADDVLTDDPTRVVSYTGELPHFINPPQSMPDVPRFRATLMEGQKDMAGVNDEMMGRMNRETSGYVFQTAINAGNLIRTRLFNKFSRSVKNIYTLALLNIRDYWDTPRKISWLGDEDSILTMDLNGVDITDGWDIDAQYGSNFSLNPDIAREQMMQMMPVYEKIPDFDWASLAERIKIGDMGGIVDRYKLAKNRQHEVFVRMIRSFEKLGQAAYVAPRDNQDHTNMLKYCDYYVMTGEYDRLDDELKMLIDRHIEERRQKQATIVAGAQGNQQQPPAPETAVPPQAAPIPGMMPVA